MLKWIATVARNYLIWFETKEAGGSAEAKRLAKQFIETAGNDIREGLAYFGSEQKILSERLGRRYDVGMAMNEAAKRAMQAKAEAKEPLVQLSATQQAALKFQEEYLQRIVERS